MESIIHKLKDNIRIRILNDVQNYISNNTNKNICRDIDTNTWKKISEVLLEIYGRGNKSQAVRP